MIACDDETRSTQRSEELGNRFGLGMHALFHPGILEVAGNDHGIILGGLLSHPVEPALVEVKICNVKKSHEWTEARIYADFRRGSHSMWIFRCDSKGFHAPVVPALRFVAAIDSTMLSRYALRSAAAVCEGSVAHSLPTNSGVGSRSPESTRDKSAWSHPACWANDR